MTVRESGLSPLADRITPIAKSLALYGIEMSVFLIFFALYFLGRGVAPDRPSLATENAVHIIDIQKSFGFFWEPAWQDYALRSDRAIDFANFMYMDMHLPFLAVFGFVLFHADRRKHRVTRNAILLACLIGIPFYHLIPVTPPRLMEANGVDIGMVDTIASHTRPRPGPLTNWYAAIPSYHFGFILVAAIATWWIWKSILLRAAAVIFTAAMWWSIVVTGNHYFLDMVLGGVICVLTFWLALRWERWIETRETARKRFLHCDDVRLPF